MSSLGLRAVFFTHLFSILFCSSMLAQSLPRLLYVKANNSHQQCPNDTAYAMCCTFNWYSKNFSYWCKTNTVMMFEEGHHMLDFFVDVRDCHNFKMNGTGYISQNSIGLPKIHSKIICNGTHNSGLKFSFSTNIQIQNLEFESCGGYHFLKNNREHHVQVTSCLAFVSVQNMSIDQVVIRNAYGYALYVENIIGTNNVTKSAFVNFKKRESGNARFNFVGDFSQKNDSIVLVMNSSWFMYGQNNQTKQYVVAAGLTVYINTTAKVQVTMLNVTLRGNIGVNCPGNLALYVVDDVGSSIVINNSHIMDGRGRKGGGLHFTARQSHKNGVLFNPGIHQFLTVIDSVFHNNSVNVTGGAMYIDYYNNSTIKSYDGILRQVNITNCTFTENSGNGAAMEIIQHFVSVNLAVPVFQTSIQNCKFDRNLANVDGPILDLISAEVTISNSNFTGSNTSIMTLRNTRLHLRNHILFKNNTAIVGAALKVCEASQIFGYPQTNVTFANNRAKKGGAIYIQQSCMDTSSVCFFQPSFPQNTPVEEFSQMAVFFHNNSAEIAGDAIYGGDLDHCTTNVPFTKNGSKDYLVFQDIIHLVFHRENQTGLSWIASNPRQACFCDQQENENYTCKTKHGPIEAFPGEQFTLPMITVGQMDGFTLGTVSTSLEKSDPKNHTLVRVSSPEASSKCTNLIFALHSNRDSAQISFKADTFDIASRYNITPVKLEVKLLTCPLGFKLSESSPYTCTCNPMLIEYLTDYKKDASSPVICNITSKSIFVPQRKLWFGCFDPSYQNDSINCTDLIITPNCDYYCSTSSDVIKVSLSNLDSQCLPNHTGIMCGACKKGCSRILGDIFECRNDCTNSNLYFLLPFLFASGFLLVIMIMALNLTVTEGTLNGLLVYTMVIQTHHSYFLDDQSSFENICWVFISWINLTFGIKACFYEGMDGYQYTWILFTQIFYFLFIQAVIVLLTRRFIFFMRLFGRNVVKVLATLFFLLYSNSVFAIFSAFQYATVYYSTLKGTLSSKLVWYYDGNVPYLGHKHAPLFIVALFWSIVLTFFTVSLLLIQCLQRQSGFLLLRWIVRLRPFYDAYTGPCHDSYRFWPGFLLFIRVGLYIIDSLIPSYSYVLFQIKMIGTAVICVLVMSLGCIFPRGVYKLWPLNVLEFSFFLNLCITSGILGVSSNTHHFRQHITVSISVTIAALTFLGILVYHLYSQIKGMKGLRRVTKWLLSVQSLWTPHIANNSQPRVSEDCDNDRLSDERDHLLPRPLPPVVKFEHYREPLVEA